MRLSRGSSWPRDQTCICLLHWQGGSLPLAPSARPSGWRSHNYYTKTESKPRESGSKARDLVLFCLPCLHSTFLGLDSHLTTHSRRSDVFPYFLSTAWCCSHLLLPEQGGCKCAWLGVREAQALVEVIMTVCPDLVVAPSPLQNWHFFRLVTFLAHYGQTMPAWWLRAAHLGRFWGTNAWTLDGWVRDRGRGRK